jgi:SAM-dependent methyltransferase
LPTATDLEAAYRSDYVETGDFQAETATRHLPVYERIMELLGPQISGPGLVVDYGCGWGGMCQLLHDREHTYVGVDLSREEVEGCRKRGLHCLEGDLNSLGEMGVRARAIVAVFVFEHLIDFEGFFDQCQRLLLPGGRILLVIPTSPLVAILGKAWTFFRPGADMPQFGECISPPWHTVIFSPEGVCRLAESNGFQLDAVHTCPKYPGHSLSVNVLKRLLAWTERIGLFAFGRKWPIMTANILVLSQKEGA